jgi:hypothetical protein
MYTFLMQDWVTIRGAPAVKQINQNADHWLDVTGFQDSVVWLDVKSFTTSGGALLNFFCQSSPTRDEALFTTVSNEGSAISINQVGLIVNAIIQSSNNTIVPIARWLRWQLGVSGSPTANWDVTFRVFIAANAGGRGRMGLPALAVPPSARAGMPASMGAPGSIRAGSSSSGRLPSPPAPLLRGTSPALAHSFRARPYGGAMASVPIHLSGGASIIRSRRS